MPGDPSYKPAFRKIYGERKANKGKDDPERFCLPDGAVRVNPLSYKIAQRKDGVVQFWEESTHSFRRFFLDGRPHNLAIEPESQTGQSIENGRVTHWSSTRLVSMTKPGWTRQASHAARRCIPYTFKRTFTLAPNWELREYVWHAILDGIE